MSGLCYVWFLVAALNSGFCVRLLRAASTRLLRAASTRGFFVRLLRCVEFPRTHALTTLTHALTTLLVLIYFSFPDHKALLERDLRERDPNRL